MRVDSHTQNGTARKFTRWKKVSMKIALSSACSTNVMKKGYSCAVIDTAIVPITER